MMRLPTQVVQELNVDTVSNICKLKYFILVYSLQMDTKRYSFGYITLSVSCNYPSLLVFPIGS